MSEKDKVPVTLLCGFLGAGKTTLLKHILEAKHTEEDFKCAVIVNDMAELNIDASLINNTSFLQSDEAMIGMQNGCICCTLQSDLVEQIIGLTQKKKFNYILIEASGVSEPHEIAPLFDIVDFEDHDDDDGHDHSGPQLGEVARLDTCVTLIDSADFHNNLASMKTYDECNVVGTIAELMMDQVEFANVILLNKGDLVNERQQQDIMQKIELLNPTAKVIKTIHSNIDVMNILNTKLYKDKDDFFVTSTKNKTEDTAESTGRRVPEACTARFDIKSFVYRARKPFHPKRLKELWLEPFFTNPIDEEIVVEVVEGGRVVEEGEDMEEVIQKMSEEERVNFEKSKVEKQIAMEKMQAEALDKQKNRTAVMGELLRSKGFTWVATSNDIIGAWQQAGNVFRFKAESKWMCLTPENWEGTEDEPNVRQDMQNEHGEYFPYKDRRQEIVFIGHMMNREAIESILNECLLTDEEMAMGPEKWKETMDEYDAIRLELEEDDEGWSEGDEEEEEEEEEENEGEEHNWEAEEKIVEGNVNRKRKKENQDDDLNDKITKKLKCEKSKDCKDTKCDLEI